ncbi:MAG: VTT domain-containing protein [Halobacteriales archaeon]|nr:VTT domain-containing protein [Halobacteriales archaeon]
MARGAAVPAERTCPSCGQSQPRDARFCGHCHASLAGLVARGGRSIAGEDVSLGPVELPKQLPMGEVSQIESSHFSRVLSPQEEEQKRRLRERLHHRGEEEAEPALGPAPKILPTTVVSMASLDRGLRPPPGIQAEPFHWRDLPDGERPTRRGAGEGSYGVYHAIEVDADVRITYQSVVTAKKSDDGTLKLLLDARTSVQKRALLEMMDQVRSSADSQARRSREGMARRMARRRAHVLHYPRTTRRIGFGLVKAEAKLGTGIINTRRKVLRGLVEIPDAIFSNVLRLDSHLSTRLGRRSLWEGIKSPDQLNADQRSVVLLMTVVLLGAAVLLLNSVIALALPGFSGEYRAALLNVGIQLFALNPVFSPPIELIVVNSTIENGAALTFTALLLGKVIGAWLLFLLGDTLRGIVEHHLGKTEKGKKRIAWLTKNTAKYGFVILFLDCLIPGMPDQILFVLAFTGVRFRSWMGGIAIGSAVKYLGIILAIYFIGPETVRHLLP